jgi:hypothetical protein
MLHTQENTVPCRLNIYYLRDNAIEKTAAEEMKAGQETKTETMHREQHYTTLKEKNKSLALLI